MCRIIAESYLLLLRIEVFMHFRGLPLVAALIRRQQVRDRGRKRHSCETLCHAIDIACVFSVKRILCLQRSAATVLLLRRHGLHAELVIGCQILPYKSHAWVEVGGVVVNDKPYIHEIYQPLERC
jgi:hypothetical protein